MIESEFGRGLFALRQEKLNQIAALAQKTYPNQYKTILWLANCYFAHFPQDPNSM